MGLLDGVTHGFDLFDPFSGEGRAGRRARKVHVEGERLPARLLGVRVRSESESGTEFRWGVEVRPPAGAPFRAACSQSPPPGAREVLRLGMALDVRRLDDDVVLDWDPSGPGGWRSRRSVEDGVDDGRLASVKGDPAEAVVEGWRMKTAFGMPTDSPEVLLAVDGAEPAWHGFFVPEYASHLLATGTALPVGSRDGGRRVRVDWLAALERHGTGAGVPLPPPTHPSGVDAVERRVEALSEGLAARAASGEGIVPHRILLDALRGRRKG